MTREFTEIREVLKKMGANFDYHLDQLNALNSAIKKAKKHPGSNRAYLEEKLRKVVKSAEMIDHDVRMWAEREGIL